MFTEEADNVAVVEEVATLYAVTDAYAVVDVAAVVERDRDPAIVPAGIGRH